MPDDMQSISSQSSSVDDDDSDDMFGQKKANLFSIEDEIHRI